MIFSLTSRFPALKRVGDVVDTAVLRQTQLELVGGTTQLGNVAASELDIDVVAGLEQRRGEPQLDGVRDPSRGLAPRLGDRRVLTVRSSAGNSSIVSSPKWDEIS